jgi:RNA polymerase sigma factor (sigma-70 family)
MADTPPFDEALRQALAGLDNEDVRIFYDYFEDLKRQARRHLGRRAATVPGSSAVAQSALLSLFCDLAVQQVPLADVDEHGYPMLWPLVLRYVERHCDKWNKYYLAKKRKGAEVSLGAGGADGDRLDPADHREAAEDEAKFVAACEALSDRLSEEERAVLEGRLRDETLEQIAARIGRSESTVSNRLSRIRAVLETM